MTDANPSLFNTSPIRLVLVDTDPIFRAGLRVWLKQYDDIQVVEDIGDRTIVLRRLRARFDPAQTSFQSDLSQDPNGPSDTDHTVGAMIDAAASIANSDSDFDSDADLDSNITATMPDTTGVNQELRVQRNLVILGSPIVANTATAADEVVIIEADVMTLCQQIKANYPTLAVLVIGPDHPTALAIAQQSHANGYWVKTASPETLLPACYQSLNGTFQWPSISPVSPNQSKTSQAKQGGPSSPSGAFDPSASSPSPSQSPIIRVGAFAQLRYRLRIEGIQHIDVQLETLLPSLSQVNSFRRGDLSRDNMSSSHPLSDLNRWVIAGRCRELRAARWCVSTLLATPSLDSLKWTGVTHSSQTTELTNLTNLTSQTRTRLTTATDELSPNIATAASSQYALGAESGTDATAVFPVPIRANLFDSLRDRLQSPLLNHTGQPLEIDILRPEKKRELLVLILHKLLDLLDELRYSNIQPQQLIERRSQLFYDLWQSILTDYFGKYYVVQMDGLELEVVTILSQDAKVVQRSIFARIPFVMDLLAHFLFQSPLEVDSVPYRLGTPEAIARAEVLLDNLVLQLGNSVIQPLLNHLADVELIKQNFYNRQLMSSRDIARFRNDLAWSYRRKQYLDDPTAIFESTYVLLTLNGTGIKQVSIYTTRRDELESLSGVPLLVTLLLEFRDALSPRMRGALAALGSSAIFILTDVIGRGIGLIGRGIIKGIGSAWKDTRNNP